MNPPLSRQERQKFFAWVVLCCIVLAVGYTSWVILRANASARHIQSQVQEHTAPQPTPAPEEIEAIQKVPHVIYLHQVGPHYGQVALTSLNNGAPRSVQTALRCDRVHYAAGNGLCLVYDSSVTTQDLLAPVPTRAILFGSDFQPRHEFTIEGIPSRTRVSPDGKYAAYTAFVNGHSYADANMSTAAVLIETATGKILGNLEEFEVWKDGRLFQAIDFNFWGITFAQDSNQFYATLRSQNTTYLLQGDIAARKLIVLHENVECPSLSPDGTRIAFKKLTPTGTWQLTTLELATMQEIPLAEKESIDDQVEWLDNERILYQKAESDPLNGLSVFVVPADGSGQPVVFTSNAESPAVIRNEKSQ